MDKLIYHLFEFFDKVVIIVPYVLLLAAIIFLYITAKRYTLNHVTYRRYFSAEGVFEGGEVYLIEEVSNHSFLPIIRLDIESRLTQYINLYGYNLLDPDGTQHFISCFTIMPFTTVRRTHKAVCTKRGLYHLETALTYFMRQEYVFKSLATIHVYPKPLAVDAMHRLDSYLQSMEPSSIPILNDPFSFSGIREYTQGDPFRAINFKATARHGGQLYVNQTDFVTGNRQMLYLNFETSLDFTTDDYRSFMETALSYSAYLLEKAFRQGYEIGFCANCQMIHGQRYLHYPMSRGMYNYEEILKQLSCIRMLRGQSLTSLLLADAENRLCNTEIFIMTLTTDERMMDACKQLELQDNQIHIIWLNEI